MICGTAAILSSSCSKNWICSCDIGTTGGVANTGSTTTYTSLIKYTDKNSAQSQCNTFGKSYVTNGTYVCHVN